ncbi:Cysteine synthase [Diplonema papillatum]|nr:Cysteine synthase [Diplonema papillatum]|eukprot:gene16372-25097_t
MASVVDSVGNTPLLAFKSLEAAYGVKVYGKAEYMNPGSSVKDRAAVSLIRQCEAAGKLQPGGTLVEATGGNTGVGLAMMGAAMGYKVTLTMPDNVSPEKIATMKAYGADIELCSTTHAQTDAGHFTQRAVVVAKATPGAVHTDQFNNTANMLAHYRTTGPEILKQLPELTAFACAAGTGGTIAGVASYLKEQNAATHTCLVDIAGSGLRNYLTTGTFARNPNRSTAEGVGIMWLVSNFAAGRGSIDGSIMVSDEEGARMAFHLAKHEGILLGPSAAMNVVGAVKVALRQKAEGIAVPHVATILCDGGASYLSKLYNEQWREKNGLLGVEETAAGSIVDKTETYLARGPDSLFEGHLDGR